MEQHPIILLVEDNANDVFFFKRALYECGRVFDLHVTRNGDEAIHYLQCACQGGDVPGYPVPKFIIVDSHLPGKDGSVFLRWISENRIYEVVPTVVLSGNDQPSLVTLAFHLGVHGYFVKPTSNTKLMELLKMIFQYWAESCVPPAKQYQFTAEGEQAVLKTDQG